MSGSKYKESGFASWISNNPVFSFFTGVILTMISVVGLWFGALYLVAFTTVDNRFFEVIPGSGFNINKTPISIGDIFGSSTNITSVIIGTSVALASAFVAVLVSRTGTQAAKAALAESKLSNKLNSPDYLAMKSGVDKLGELSFLNDALIYAYSAYKDLMVSDKSYTFKPDTVLLDRLSELVVSPHFSMILNQAAKFKNDMEGLNDVPVKETHKRIAHLIVELKVLENQTDLEVYQSKLLNALKLLRKAIEEISWTKYIEKFENRKEKDPITAIAKKYPVVMYLLEDNVGLPSWNQEEYIAPVVKHTIEKEGLFAAVERLSLALFPALAGEAYTKSYADKPLENDSIKYPALISSILSQGGTQPATDGVVVRIAHGDADFHEELLKKIKAEAISLGMTPLPIDMLNGGIEQYSKPDLIKFIEEAKESNQKILLIPVINSIDHLERWQGMCQSLGAHLRYLDQILVLRNFNTDINDFASKATEVFDMSDEEDIKYNKEACQQKLNAALNWFKVNKGVEAEEHLAFDLSTEIQRRYLIERYMRSNVGITPGSLSLIAVVAHDFDKPVKFNDGTIGATLDSSSGGNSNYVIAGDLAKIAGVDNPVKIDINLRKS